MRNGLVSHVEVEVLTLTDELCKVVIDTENVFDIPLLALVLGHIFV